MYLKQPMLVLTKDEGEGVEHFICSKPDIAGFSHFNSWLKVGRVGLTDKAIQPVRGDQQIVVTNFREIVHLAAKFQDDTQFIAAPLQDVEQALARDAGNN